MNNKAYYLAMQAINNPSLLNQLSDDTYVSFVIGVAKYHKDLAMKLDKIRSIGKPKNKIKFWQAIGILTPEQV